MNNLNEIKNRIGAVEETRKITNAMKLVSSARVKRILKDVEYNTLYYERVTSAMRDILATVGAGAIDHPYFVGHGKKEPRKLYAIFAGDKGLCGSYNHNVLDYAKNVVTQQSNPSLITIGLEARDYFRRYQIHTNGYILRFPLEQTLNNARTIALAVNDLYENLYVDEVYAIFTNFFGHDKGKPVSRQLLPINVGMHGLENIDTSASPREIIYEPSPQETFDLLIPQYLIGILYDTLVQAYAGEQFARMNAMESSTTNADEILKSLRQEYNMARQSAITNEITEASSAAIMNEIK